MGAGTFITEADGSDLAIAFQAAREAAAYEHGHGGYTGTLAEKDDVVVIEATPLNPNAAYALATRLINEGDPRVDDKWGPAGAIAVNRDTREVTFTGLSAASTEEADLLVAAKVEAYRKRTCRRGEKIIAASTYAYSTVASTSVRGSRHITNATVVVTIRKAKNAAPTTDGWVLFGWASS